MGNTLEKWALSLDAQGFLLWLDKFKAMAERLVQEETSGGLGPTGCKDFSIGISHPHQPWTASMHMQMNRNQLRTTQVLRCIAHCGIKVENIWDMDEKGFTLGTTNRAKVIARTSRRLLAPRATHDGTGELITVIECCGAR